MAQTLTYDEILDLAEAAHRRIDKKYSDDPSYIIRKRVANTATEVIRKVKDLAFSDLATDMYLICDEVGYKFFSSKYRNVIELSSQNSTLKCCLISSISISVRLQERSRRTIFCKTSFCLCPFYQKQHAFQPNTEKYSLPTWT